MKNIQISPSILSADFSQLGSKIKRLEEGGADMIEIGIPFSDPQADGPIIQKASEIALSNGISLPIIFDQVRSIRKKTDIPIALMGYYNPILAYGIDSFLNDCKISQIDGIILPDLPLDEGTFFCEKAKSDNISPILLVAPNTSNERIKLISKLSQDLIYAVSILGITGGDMSAKENLKKKSAEELSKVTGGLNLPADFKLPF